jgi:hypothetical protein
MTRTFRSRSSSSLILLGVTATLATGCSGGLFIIGQDEAGLGDAASPGQDGSGGGTGDSSGGGTDDSSGGGTHDSTGGGVACGTTTCSSGAVCCYGPCGQGPATCMPGPACPQPGIACRVDGGGTADTGAGCTTNADCAGGGICGFRQADGCSASGSCFPAPGAVCQAYSAGCACDGSTVNVICNGLPTGYAPKPLQHSGMCTGTDASMNLHWYLTCGAPVCSGPSADAGVQDASACHALGTSCSNLGETCGGPNSCNQVETCQAFDPQSRPGGCPISSRKFKDDIEYLDPAGLEGLHDEVLRMRLATYNYKGQYADPNPKHLGFIVEDNPESLAVDRGHDRVDMYGYLSMVVATMQVQEKEISDLRRDLSLAQKGVCRQAER